MSDSIFSAQYFQNVIEAMAGGLAILDEDYKILFRNKHAVTVSGLSPDFWAPGNDIRELLAVGMEFGVYKDYATVDDLIHTLTRELRLHGSCVTMRHQPDGKIIAETFTKIPTGGYVGTYSDVTDHKMKEVHLGKLTEDLKLKTQAAEAANEAKSQFLANMSHEIRTPMNGILGMSELILGTELSNQQRAFAKTIYNSGNALLDIINDILDFSKIEAGKVILENQPFDMQSLIDDIGDLLGNLARKKGIDLVTHFPNNLPHNLIGDASYLRQILLNLVGNAIKFTAEGYIFLGVSGVVENGSLNALITIKDTGIGIASDKLETIFGSFDQADSSTTRKFGGSGLGLTISRSLLSMMNGTLTVQSVLSKGSTFEVRLKIPLAKSDSKANPQSLDLSNRPILIVDDINVSRQALAAKIKGWGGRPILAKSAQMAIEILAKAKAQNIDIPLMITDYSMPETDGLELVKSIQAKGDHPNLKVIALSSLEDNEIAHSFKTVGVNSYFLKPLRASLLEKTLTQDLEFENGHDENSQHAHKNLKAGTVEKPSFQEDSMPGNTHGRPRILIAEDDANNRLVMKHMLANFDVSPVFVVNGQKACESVMSQNFDIVLMDISMPVMDGLEATQLIRDYENSKDLSPLPIIAVTAHALKGDKEKFLDAGMNDYIPKPVSQKTLIKTISKWVGSAVEVAKAA